MTERRSQFLNLMALLFGGVVAFLVGGLITELCFGSNDLYYIHEPGISETIYPPKEIVSGGPAKIRFSTNQQGMRGRDYPADTSVYRILAVGGSTTLCSYLEDNQAWPALIERQLNRMEGQETVWMGNIGQDGFTTRNHLLQLKHYVPQYPVDALLILSGINDLVERLWFHDDYDPYFLEDEINAKQLMYRTFSRIPDKEIHPFYKRFGLWKLARRTRRFWERRVNREKDITNLLEWRKHRRRGRRVFSMPDLTIALAEYERNIRKLILLAKGQDTRLIFLTQPTLWHADMTEEEKNAVFFGFIGDPEFLRDHAHYASGIMAECMNLYNRSVLKICREQGVEAIDLATILPRNLDVFYDECHFTEYGAKLVADEVIRHLQYSVSLRRRKPKPTSSSQ